MSTSPLILAILAILLAVIGGSRAQDAPVPPRPEPRTLQGARD